MAAAPAVATNPTAATARAPARAVAVSATDVANVYTITADAPRTAGHGTGPLSQMATASTTQFVSAVISVVDIVSRSPRFVNMVVFDRSVVTADRHDVAMASSTLRRAARRAGRIAAAIPAIVAIVATAASGVTGTT
jgi:hypothetical protein